MPSWLWFCGESGHHKREGVADIAAKKQRRSHWGQGRFFQSPYLMRISCSQADPLHVMQVPRSPFREVPNNGWGQGPHKSLILTMVLRGKLSALAFGGHRRSKLK